jgi:hypothetical protein
MIMYRGLRWERPGSTPATPLDNRPSALSGQTARSDFAPEAPPLQLRPARSYPGAEPDIASDPLHLASTGDLISTKTLYSNILGAALDHSGATSLPPKHFH